MYFSLNICGNKCKMLLLYISSSLKILMIFFCYCKYDLKKKNTNDKLDILNWPNMIYFNLGSKVSRLFYYGLI